MESSRVQDYDYDSELKYLSAEWNDNNNNKPHRVSRHNTMSRRFLPSSNFPIVSSTASSPGYTFKDEIIDPSTYCFSTALKALQAKSGHQTWEFSSSPSDQVGLALNSKWNEAEKYICNPLSGKVPLECLSAKSLSGRSFRHLSSSSSNRITMSAPLLFSSPSKPFSSSSNTTTSHSQQDLISMKLPINLPEKKEEEEGRTRDVGTQSTPPYLSSSSPSPASTPSIIERSVKRLGESSPVSNSKTKSEDDEVEEEKIEKEREETMKTVTVTTTYHRDEKEEQVCSSSSSSRSGCFSWTRFLRSHPHHKTAKPTKYLKPC